MQNKIRELSHLIGNTPLLAINCLYRGEKRTIYAKAEYFNFTGSIKDRMALHILEQAYLDGKIKPGDMIVEATSGNTGIAFSAIGRALGHPVTIFMPNWMSQERINLIKSFGAKIVSISKQEGGFIGSIKRSEEFAHSIPNTFLPQQFANQNNCRAHYKSTGPEIWQQLISQQVKPDAFIAGVGTGGTIMGVGKFLREKDPNIKLYPLEPKSSPTLSTGHQVGEHRIQGISDEFIPEIVDLRFLDKVVCVDDGDAIIMAKKLAAQLGIGVGISSGANFLGALQAQNELGRDKTVVTIFSDDNKKYLSTDLFRDEPIKSDFMSSEIELLDFRAIGSVFT
jgi:cysteine synthase